MERKEEPINREAGRRSDFTTIERKREIRKTKGEEEKRSGNSGGG